LEIFIISIISGQIKTEKILTDATNINGKNNILSFIFVHPLLMASFCHKQAIEYNFFI